MSLVADLPKKFWNRLGMYERAVITLADDVATGEVSEEEALRRLDDAAYFSKMMSRVYEEVVGEPAPPWIGK